jgi:hypothetical protein
MDKKRKIIMKTTQLNNRGTARPLQTVYRHRDLRLLIEISRSGVARIMDGRKDADQLLLWPELTLPLENPEVPFGKALYEELESAMAGSPVPPKVPWDIRGPRWYQDLYRDLWRLAPGTETDPPALFPVGKGHKDRQEIIMVITACRLWPLVPLHRVRPPSNGVWKFPFGEDWRRYLLAKENNHKNPI